MMTAQIERITPQIAAAMLEANNDNRPLGEITVAQYSSDMLAGNWKMTGQPIIIADNGQLNDGQHRLAAVIKSNVAVDMMVVRGAPRESRDAIDLGKVRTAAHVVQMFHVTNGTAVAALANIVISWERAGKTAIGSRARVSKSDIISRARTDERLKYAVNVSERTRSILTRKQAAFARYIIPDSPRADEFFDRLSDGVGLEHGSPILALRQWCLRNGRKVSDAIGCEAILRAWCAFRDGRSMINIKLIGELPQP